MEEYTGFLNKHDYRIVDEILRSGKDVIIRRTSSGISILAQKTDLKKKKEFSKEIK